MKQCWEIKKLGDVATILDNQRKPVTKKDRCNGIYPYYGASGVQDYVDKYIFDGRYLLVGEDGAKWGASDKSAYIVDGKCWVNNHAHILKLDNSINDKMVEYYLVYKDLSEYITGAIVPKLTQQALKQIPIPVPERAEQERIVGELDCLSGIIANKRAQLRELDTLAQSIFYTMFGDPITNDKGWQTKKLSEISSIVGGSTPSTKDEKNWNGDLNWVTPAELNGTLYYGETQRKITTEGARGLELLPVGTVLLSSRAPIGKLAITTVPMYCNQGFKNVVCGESINNIYVYYYLFATIENVKALGVGATFKEVSKRAVENYHILVPPIDLQQQFAEKIENIERQKELITKSIKETEDLFNSRMSYYFD